MRYFLTLSYCGTRFFGWQKQPNAVSVQATIEKVMATILRQPIEVVGCGRTDTGVHARGYVAHFDFDGTLPPTFIHGMNTLLPNDIAIHACHPVHAEAHARFDAFERSYVYHIALRKDPFLTETAWFFPQGQRLDLEKMQAVGQILLEYGDFFPFCKTDSGLDNYRVEMKKAHWEWVPAEHRLSFHITANRFLRGMVRLTVGACVNAGLGKLTLTDVQTALEQQTMLKRSLSVPPQGLFLMDIKYPFEISKSGGD